MQAYMILKNQTSFGGKNIDQKGLLFAIDMDLEGHKITIERLVQSDYSVNSGTVVITDTDIINKTDDLVMSRTIRYNEQYTEEELFSDKFYSILGEIFYFKAPDDDAAKLLFEVNY